MNSKSSEDAAIVDVESELAVEETKEGSSLETRTDRIRRLNRERQRRRRMKLRMSRHGDFDTTMAPDASNVNMNLDNLEELDNAGFEEPDRTKISVKPEQAIGHGAALKTRSSRGRPSRRKQASKNASNTGEFATESTSGSANNAITGSCHGQLTTSSSNEPSQDTSDQIAVLVVASEIEVFGESPTVLNGGGQASELVASPEDEESVARGSQDGDEGRSPRKKRHSTANSDDEMNVTVRREKQRELKRKQKERMTPDQVEALRARYREWRRRRKEVMTAEQLEIIRRGNRERQRRRRERLGVRKRLASNQSRGASDAVIQGIKNMQSQGKNGSETMTSGESPKGSVSDLMNATGLATIDDKTAANMPVAPSVGMPLTTVPNDLPTMVTSQLQPTIVVPNASAAAQMVPAMATTANTQSVSSRMVPCGPGIGIPGMPPGAFFPGMPMSGMQGTIFPNFVPVTAGQGGVVSVSGNQPTSMVTTIPISGVSGLSAQGAFLSGIPVTSTTASSPGFPQAGTMPIPREGQVLHNFQTLLPLTPVQGMQGAGQGMTFFTQLPFTGVGPIQGFPDPKYTIASQGNPQIAGLPPGTQIIQVPLPAEIPTEPAKTVPQEQRVAPDPQTKPKGRGRGRKRNTSAAEMLASLSNYAPPTSTPMASMLSALASSARDRMNNTSAAMAGSTQSSGGEEIHSEKSQTVVQSEGNAPVLVQVPQNQPPGYAMHIGGPQRDPYAVRTVVTSVAGQTTDVNANSYSLAGINDSPAGIPHMNTFLTTMGAANRAGTSFPGNGAVARPPGVVLIEPGNDDYEKISVAVATETIKRESKATNTGATTEQVMSIGTMTDSLYQSSVATNTDMQNLAPADSTQEEVAMEEENTESAAAVIEGTD